MQAQGLGGTRRAIQREPFRYDFCAPYPRGRRAPHGRTAAHSAIGRRFGRYPAGGGRYHGHTAQKSSDGTPLDFLGMAPCPPAPVLAL